MKRSISAFLTLSLLLSVTACGSGNPSSIASEPAEADYDEISSSAPDSQITVSPDPDEILSVSSVLRTADHSVLEEQVAIDQELLAEAQAGYSFEAPLVVVNPYGNAPLSALAIFDTEEETEVTVTIKGHDAKDDITTTFPREKRHILPIAGLYAGQETQVELTLSDGSSISLSIATEPVDEDLVNAEVIRLDEEFYDYEQLTFAYYNYGTLAYDSEGDLRFYSQFPALPLTRLSNGHFAAYTREFADKKSGTFAGIVEIDICGRIYNQYMLPGGAHHEIRELSNGNLLVGTSHDDLSVINCSIAEIERDTGNLVWQLDLCDLMDTTDGIGVLYERMNQAGFAVWFHDNSFCYDEATDSLLISGRIVDAVVCVEKSTQKLKWILGTNEGWNNADPSLFFTPIDNDGDFEWQFAQHNVDLLPDLDGNPATLDVLMFDNGCARTKDLNQGGVSGKDVYSRAVVYHVDTAAMTVSQEWEYGKERGDSWYSAYISGANYEEDTGVFWICSGGIQHDASADNYDLSIAGFNGDLKVEYSALIDAVLEAELKYELKVHRNVYRSARFDIYGGRSTSTDVTVPGNCFVVKNE
ncbi:MAG: aryl-sulfate sulfotransferase [Lachnospiraceae bacterium]|nr:aryl-sulfate sulfotransferase [Lachnospiraceae bacterium]